MTCVDVFRVAAGLCLIAFGLFGLRICVAEVLRLLIRPERRCPACHIDVPPSDAALCETCVEALKW